MKRMITFLLTLMLILSLAACAAPASEPTQTPPTDEYERAIWYGFVPKELAAADGKSPVSWAQYCKMLGGMIAAYDETLCSEWEGMTKNAPETEMKRDGAMVSLLFAAKTMGFANFNAEPPAEFQPYAEKVWDCATMDYPVFDWNTPIDLGEGCSDNNHVGPAYDFCLRRVSVESGKSLLEFDDKGDLRLEQALTLREAALSVIRLYESEYGEFVSSVSNETLKLAQAMPTVSYDNLPRWHGYTVPPRMWWYNEGTQETYGQEEIGLYASFGFNFLRAPLLTEELFIDSDISKPNRAVFNTLDELLTQAAKHGIHICMDLHAMPGFTTNQTDDDDILFDDEATQELFARLWGTIAEYFRDIPSNLLSFNLLNEPHPHSDGILTDEIYSAVMHKAIDAIREQSPERLIIASGVGVSWAEPCEGLANSKIAQGTSVYFLNNGADMWPLYYINKNINGNEGDLTLNGSFPQGTSLTISVMQYSGADYKLFANDTLAASFSVAGNTFDETGLTIKSGATLKKWNGDGGAYGWYTLDVPINEACSVLRLKTGSYYEIYSILVKTPTANYAIMANDGYVSSQTPPMLTLRSDGTIEAQAEDTLFAMNEDSLAAMMEKYVRFTERTGQECVLLEFGFNSTIPYAVALSAADAFFNAADRCGLGWCSWYDDFGPMINYEAALEYVKVSGGDDYRRTDAEYTALDSRYSYLPELMEVYQKHMR